MVRERFQILDGWRGICALVVALYHLNVYGHFYQVHLIRNAWFFVDFFFVLSGFVITHAYMRRVGTWGEIRSFIVRRFGRLWPLHVAVLAALIALEFAKMAFLHFGVGAEHAAFSEDHSVVSIFTNLLLIHSLGVHDGMTWNPPSWSISTEFYTYIVFALVFTVARRDLLSLALSVVIVLSSAGVILAFAKYGGFGEFEFSFARTLYGFFIGHLTYRVWKTGFAEGAFRQPGLMEFLAVAAIGILLTSLPLDVESRWCFAAPFVFAFVVWVFAHERGPVSRLMNSRPLGIIGERSYSIYMVHAALVAVGLRGLAVLEKIIGTPLKITMSFPWASEPIRLVYFGSAWLMDGLAAAYLLCVLAVAGITFRFVEQPGRNYFNGLAWATAQGDSASDPRTPASENDTPRIAGAVVGLDGVAQNASTD